MNPFVTIFLVGALALVTSLIVTPVVRGAALRWGRISLASPDRWHARPTPNLGGVAIFVGFAVAVVLEMLLVPADLSIRDVSARAVVPLTHRDGLLLAAVMIFALGLIDDLVHLRPSAKLVGQLVAASVLLMSGIGVWLTGFYIVDVMVSLFWFIGITNALNLLDNMDGLAGGVGAIAASFMGVNFLLAGDVGLAGVAFAFAGALVGFLVHNYPPARIFMGDSGSLFTGLVLAGLALSPAPGLSRSLFAVVVVPAVVLAVPILDTTFVTLTRLLEGRPISKGGEGPHVTRARRARDSRGAGRLARVGTRGRGGADRPEPSFREPAGRVRLGRSPAHPPDAPGTLLVVLEDESPRRVGEGRRRGGHTGL